MSKSTKASSTTPTTLEALAEALGKPEAHAADAYFSDADAAALTDRGRQIASSRLLTDEERIYLDAYAFWTRASDAQHEALVGFSLQLLTLAVDCALELRRVTDSSAAAVASETTHRAANAAQTERALKEAVALHAHATRTLLTVAGGEAAAASTAKSASVQADDGLPASMRHLAKTARDLIKHTKDGVAMRVKLSRLDERYAAKLEAAADAVESATRDATTARAKKIQQGGIDLLDGKNLALLSHVIHAFDEAHELDSTIPRLVPIATRRYIGNPRKAKTIAAPPAPEKPATA